MTNLTPTNLLSGIAMVGEKYQSGEWRAPDSAAMSTAYIGEKTMPSMSELRKREDRAVYFDFPVRKALGSATERTALHTGNRTDSLRTLLSWKTVIDTFSISMKQLDTNTLSFEEAFAKGIKSCVFNNLKQADDWYIAQLLANKTQINVGGVRGDWDTVNYNMALYATQKDYWKEQIEANLSNNEYMSEMTIVADSLAFTDMVRSLNQGQANSTNLSYQFGSGEIIKTSKSILSGYDGSAIAFPNELSGLFFWIPKQNRGALDINRAMSGEVGSFGSIQVPIVNDKGNVMYTIDAAISMYANRTNTSASNGNKQDVLYQIEISWDMAYMAAPLSSFRATGDFAGKTDSVIHSFGLTPA
jgi:hypothetical protein